MPLYRLDDAEELASGHEGYVAGLQPGGDLTGLSIDVRVHLDGRYVAYVPRCECGWTGPPFSTTPSGFAACEQLWRAKHLQLFLRARGPNYAGPRCLGHPRLIRGTLATEPA